jgi:propane monooxygenase large subunit
MVPCLVREDMVIDKVDGQWRTYCHEMCRWTDAEAFRPTFQGRATPNMGQLVGTREWETMYHNWNFADIVTDMGYVRDDGKTLVAQPHLHLEGIAGAERPTKAPCQRPSNGNFGQREGSDP